MLKKGLICITGIDGSGKTTISKDVVEYYFNKGLPIKYTYARYQLKLAKPLYYLANKLVFKKNESNYNDLKNRKQIINNKFRTISLIYYYFLLFDYIIQLLIMIKIPLLFNKIIICDRYIYDTILTDISVDMNLSIDDNLFFINNCFKFIPKPDLLIYIDVNEEIAFKRKTDVISVEYLIDRKKKYLETLNYYNCIQLNGNLPREDVFNECIRRIENEFN